VCCCCSPKIEEFSESEIARSSRSPRRRTPFSEITRFGLEQYCRTGCSSWLCNDAAWLSWTRTAIFTEHFTRRTAYRSQHSLIWGWIGLEESGSAATAALPIFRRLGRSRFTLQLRPFLRLLVDEFQLRAGQKQLGRRTLLSLGLTSRSALDPTSGDYERHGKFRAAFRKHSGGNR
jgi:hypothetical protein